MKILLVANKVKTYNLGFQNEIEPLLEAGHEVVWAADFSSFVGDYKTATPCEARSIDIRSNPFNKSNIKAYKQLLAILREEKFDAVQCSTPIGGMLARLAAKRMKIGTVIYEAHGFLFFKGAPLLNRTVYKLQEHIMSRWTDALVTIIEEDYNAAKKMKLRKGGKLYMIHGAGVEVGQTVECDREALRASIGLPSDAVAVVSAGILNKNKNNRVIIEALPLAKSEKVHYVICGEGDGEGELRELAKSLGVEDRVHFLGFRTDMPQVMCASDIFAMMISSVVTNENTAMTVMPFILIIQLVMSGLIFELSGAIKTVSALTISRWGLDAICATANTNAIMTRRTAKIFKKLIASFSFWTYGLFISL